ncbi:hypothetical protein BSZ07_37700 [Streptomyces sp. M1013]|uniref:hypothetical protein n=1 Tax=Streptomyces sp. M1013 TaxID=549798 RepID=UPI000978E9CE|nr:hypothetical protein [Streptomyces sp. M1013]OMI84625.1 hypothetical protein BSZ07_37700 [Streptomyces sp. M1013]
MSDVPDICLEVVMTPVQTAVAPPTPSVSATAVVPSATPAAPAAADATSVWPAVVSGAFLAAALTAAINIWLARRKSREEEISRLRTAFAEAFAAHSAYKEMPYAIRRRRFDAAAEERVRLSETLREIQGNLSYHLAWTKIESEAVGRAYADLVQELRKTAGAAMRAAWETSAIESDTGMNIPPAQIDLSALQTLETAYIAAVREHLRALNKPWWSR